jgi:hypothetical protein
MKSIAHHLFIFVIIAMTLSSCKTPQPIDEMEFATKTEIPFTNISSGYLTGNGDEGIGGLEVRIIQSEGNWEILRAEMNSVNPTQNEVSIDFDQNTILAYFDDIRPSGGYAIQIVSVIETNDEIQVSTKFTLPTDAAVDIMTQPFHIVSIPKTKKKITFFSLIE